MSLLQVWVLYAIFGTSAFSALFVWAVRAGQFRDLDRGRYIALTSPEPIKTEKPDRKPSRLDRYTWVALAIVSAGVFASALWVAGRIGGK
jgi:nitrogen fixation-related uncharacterized protein